MPKTILLVDDSASLRHVVKIAMRDAGYEVLEAGDGKEALKFFDGKKIHMVVSDLNMPNMNGIEFCKEVKKMENYKFTPIIMLTTETDESKKKEGQEAGIRAWVIKPFQPEVLLNAIAKLVLP